MHESPFSERPHPIQIPKIFARHANHFIAFSLKANVAIAFISESVFDFWTLKEIDLDIRCLRAQLEPMIEESLYGNKIPCVFRHWVLWNTGREEHIAVTSPDCLFQGPDGVTELREWSGASTWCKKFGNDCSFVTCEKFMPMPRILDAQRITSWASFDHHQYTDLGDHAKLVMQLPYGAGYAELEQSLAA